MSCTLLSRESPHLGSYMELDMPTPLSRPPLGGWCLSSYMAYPVREQNEAFWLLGKEASGLRAKGSNHAVSYRRLG
jgi:hypothetical protein